MPKRFGSLYEPCFTLERLFAAFKRARKGKRKKRAAHEFERDLGANLQSLHERLMDGDYWPAPCDQFMVWEPKPRMISAPAFRDTVVQHAIYEAIYPIFDASFIHDSYGCRLGKGTHRASDQAQRYLRESAPESYTLQTDIRRFYYSIDRIVLYRLLERKIKDQRLLDLMMRFAWQDSPAGVPIGCLLSQLYALIYLDPFDHWMKREQGVRRYVRYVDDTISFDLSRAEAKRLRDSMVSWLDENLHLSLSRFTIAPVSRGVNFVGYRTWRSCRLVRKHSLSRFSVAIRRGDIQALISILGHAKRTASYRHLARRLVAERPALYLLLPASVRTSLTEAANA